MSRPESSAHRGRRAVTVRSPAKVNLQLSVGGRRPGRLSRPRHRVPGRRSARRGRRPAGRRRSHRHGHGRRRRERPCRTATTWPPAQPSRSPRPPESTRTSPWRCARPSRSPAAWPADRRRCRCPGGLRRIVGNRTSNETSSRRVAAELGADVPFALMGGTAIGLGTGTQLTPALARGRFHWVFAIAETGCPQQRCTPSTTGWPESRSGSSREVSDAPDDRAARGRRDRRSGARCRTTFSGQPSRCARGCASRSTSARSTAPSASIVSGSGPTCAFLARDDEHALDLAVALSAADVCRSVVRADAPGPRCPGRRRLAMTVTGC